MAITVSRWDDAQSWNLCTASMPGAHFQQSWEWGELAPDLGGRAVRLAAHCDGEFVGAMQVFIQRLGRTGRTFLYVPRGPAIARPAPSLLGPLLDAARSLGREHQSVGIKVEPNVPACDLEWQEALRAFGLHPTYPPTQPRSSWVLDITPDEDALTAAMKQKTRYNIRLAERKGVEVAEAGVEDVEAFYALYEVTARRDGFFIHGKDVYRRMFELFDTAGNFCILFARVCGTLVAAVTLVRFGDTCWYLHGASSNEHRNVMAPHLLQWEAIRRAKRWGCRLYDFRAVPDVLREDQDMYGVYRFKEGFGGHQLTTLDTYAAPYDIRLYSLWQLSFRARFLVDAWQRRRRGLPARQFA